MMQSKLPLYPKISSIYNKILQLAIAVALVLLLINLAIFNSQQADSTLEQHFDQLGHDLINHSKASVELLIKQGDRKVLTQFVEQDIVNELIASVHLYSETGQLLASSNNQSINDLYGISQDYDDANADNIPFVVALGQQGELGYLRFTVKRSHVLAELSSSQQHSQELLHFVILLAGFIGFLLTRGFARFSRKNMQPVSAASVSNTGVKE